MERIEADEVFSWWLQSSSPLDCITDEINAVYPTMCVDMCIQKHIALIWLTLTLIGFSHHQVTNSY